MSVMERDAGRMRYGLLSLVSAINSLIGVSSFREGGPTIFAVVKHGKNVDDIVNLLISAWKGSGAYDVSLERWKKSGKKGSGDV